MPPQNLPDGLAGTLGGPAERPEAVHLLHHNPNYFGRLAVCIQDLVWFSWYAAYSPGQPTAPLTSDYNSTLKKDFSEFAAADALLAVLEPEIHVGASEITGKLYALEAQFSSTLESWNALGGDLPAEKAPLEGLYWSAHQIQSSFREEVQQVVRGLVERPEPAAGSPGGAATG